MTWSQYLAIALAIAWLAVALFVIGFIIWLIMKK